MAGSDVILETYVNVSDNPVAEAYIGHERSYFSRLTSRLI